MSLLVLVVVLQQIVASESFTTGVEHFHSKCKESGAKVREDKPVNDRLSV